MHQDRPRGGYPCQRAIPLSTARISLPGLGSLKNKDSDLLNKGVAKSDSTRELLNRNTGDPSRLILYCHRQIRHVPSQSKLMPANGRLAAFYHNQIRILADRDLLLTTGESLPLPKLIILCMKRNYWL